MHARALRQPVAPLLLMLVSGFAGLAFQIVWTQQAALGLGHESAAVLAVLAAFFGGLAIGSGWIGRRAARSADPRLAYAGCEALIGGWGLLLAFAMPAASATLQALIGADASPLRQWALGFGGLFLMLLPATMAMGATLPLMARITARPGHEASAVAPLYAANTLGAMLGVLAAAFLLVPALGLRATALLAGLGNLAVAWLAPRWLPPPVADFELPAARPALPEGPAPDAVAGRALLLRLALTGLLGIGYEVLAVRVLSQIAEDTVYTYALLLAVYLVGTAAGAAWLPALARRWPDAGRRRDRLLALLSLAVLAGSASLWWADALRAAVAAALGHGAAAALAGEAASALAAFGLPTLLMGALFAELAGAAQAGRALASALAVNTLGAALAAPLFGVLLFPALGPKAALLVVALGYLLLLAPRGWRAPLPWLPLAAAGLIALAFPPLRYASLPDGGRVLRYEDGAMAAVSVVEDAAGVRRLRIDNRQQEGSNATRRVDGRQALLPLLLHPAPRRALFLGLGTGVTASVAAEDPRLAVTAVELVPEVIAAAPLFAVPGATLPNAVAADARRWVRSAPAGEDVIVADNFHPARSGAGSLYTVEHFTAVRARLADGGLFCQWLPLHQLDMDSLASIVAAFVEVFPDAHAVLANYGLDTPTLGLIGTREARRWSLAALDARIASAQPAGVAARHGLDDALAVLGSVVAGPQALQLFAQGATVNRDDRPVVSYRAPWLSYAPDSTPAERLARLLAQWQVMPGEVLDAGGDPAGPQRLAAYWQARNRFIALGRGVRPGGELRALLAQVGAPLLEVLAISPEFRPAYDPLLAMADRLAADDPEGARLLWAALAERAPQRPEAPARLARTGER